MLHDFESDFLQKILIKDFFQKNIEYIWRPENANRQKKDVFLNLLLEDYRRLNCEPRLKVR